MSVKFEQLKRVRSLAIVGATTLVGKELVDILSEHRVPVPGLKLIAATDSLENLLSDPDDESGVQLLGREVFTDMEVAIFAAPEAVSRKYIPIAVEAGCLVVDLSGAMSEAEDVPVVVPEINGPTLRDSSVSVVASPGCAATMLALALKPLQDRFGLERVVAATYEPASQAGKKGFEELSTQTTQLLNGEEMVSESPHPAAFNLVPMVGAPLADGSSGEEARTARELRRVLGMPELGVALTEVNVPTFSGFGAAVTVELSEKFGTIEQVREAIDGFPGLRVLDNPGAAIYPTNRECTGSDQVFVGRLRRDDSVMSGVSFWVMTDNLRKGAALNALESLETLYNYRRMS